MKEWIEYFRNDRFAALAGVELVEVEPGRAVARMAVDNCHLNAVGSVMGGAIFTLADFAFAVASNSHGTVAVAIDVSISFLRAVNQGTLTVEAVEVSRGRTLGHYDARVTDDAGKLVALFHGTAFRKPDPLPVQPAPKA